MRKFLFIIIVIFLLTNISATCDDEQIDINTASLEELDKLTGIGLAYAQNIINTRPHNNVDDLINTKGIGVTTLEKIKQQGLACVEEEVNEEIKETTKLIYEDVSKNIQEEKEIVPIILNSKSIKSENNKESLKKNIAIGGVATFCVIFGAVFFLKSRKRKNEFQ